MGTLLLQMSEYRIEDLSRLVKDGIQIVQSLQEEQEAKRTRSSSLPNAGAQDQKPEIQPRTKSSSTSSCGPGQPGGSEVHDGNQQESSRESSRVSGRSTASSSLSESDRGWRLDHNSDRDDKDPPRDNNGDGGANLRGNWGYNPDRTPMSGRIGEPKNGGTSGPGDNADYAAILDRDVTSLIAEEAGAQTMGMEIKEATESDIEEVLSQTNTKSRRRLRGMEEIRAEVEGMASEGNPVKKGIEESTVLTTLREERTSDHGVIRSVQKSEQHRLVRSVSVGTVPKDARDVSIPDGILSRSDALKQYQDKTTDEKIDDIIYNQRIILTRLQDITQIKEDLMDMKRLLTNHSLTLSTIEGYISSLMIVIPGSGKNDKEDEKEINPDLKPVIGRDRSRGVREITEKKISITAADLYNGIPSRVDSKYIQEELDFTKNNAANFVPDDEMEALSIICHMIEDAIGHNQKSKDMIKWVNQQMGSTPMVKLYELVSEALDGYTEDEYNEDNK
nr:phosphoprotein [Paramyxoviridae sp.]